jgi:hypothetical protein
LHDDIADIEDTQNSIESLVRKLEISFETAQTSSPVGGLACTKRDIAKWDLRSIVTIDLGEDVSAPTCSGTKLLPT